MADSSRVGIYYIEEVTRGTTPASALATIANATAESFGEETATTTTNALRGDYVKPNLIRTKVHGTGGLNYELAYGDMDPLKEGVFRSDWSAAIAISATDISAADSDDSFNRLAGSFVTDGIVVGMWVKVGGFTAAANNTYWRVTSVAALKIIVDGALTTEAAGNTITIKNSGMLRNGVVKHYYTFERKFQDLTNRYIVHRGVALGGLQEEWTVDNPVTGQLTGFIGNHPVTATATAGSGAPAAGTTTRVMNGIDEFFALTEGGVAVTVAVSKINYTLTSPVEPAFKLGSLGPHAVGFNSFNLTGTASVYMDDAAFALIDKQLNFTATSLRWRATDIAGNTYQYTVPAIRYMRAPVNAGGIDQRMYVEFEWGAELDSTTSAIMQIDRIAV